MARCYQIPEARVRRPRSVERLPSFLQSWYNDRGRSGPGSRLDMHRFKTNRIDDGGLPRSRTAQGWALGLGILCILGPALAQADPCARPHRADRLLCLMERAKDQAAAEALAPELGALGRDAIPRIRSVLATSKNGQVRAAALCALVHTGGEARVLVPAIAQVLGDVYAPVRRCAASALAAIGPQAWPVLGLLVGLLSDKDVQVQVQAVRTLGVLSPVTPWSVPVLARVLDGKRDVLVKREAARSLAHFGPLSVATLPVLRRSIFDPDEAVRRLTVEVLGAMAPLSRSEIPSLSKTLQEDKSFEVRRAAAAALGRLGPLAVSSLPMLRRVIAADGAPRKEIILAIKAIEAVPAPKPPASTPTPTPAAPKAVPSPAPGPASPTVGPTVTAPSSSKKADPGQAIGKEKKK